MSGKEHRNRTVVGMFYGCSKCHMMNVAVNQTSEAKAVLDGGAVTFNCGECGHPIRISLGPGDWGAAALAAMLKQGQATAVEVIEEDRVECQTSKNLN